MKSKLTVLIGAILSVAVANAADQSPASLPYRDASLPTAKRVTDLISRMTLEEKAAQLGHTAPAIPRLGVPEYNWWNEGLHGVARAGIATVFPQAIAMAASFDAPLMQQVADTISTEFRAKYRETLKANGGSDWYRGLTVWSPNINIFRDPRWGRGQETYGEDPYLTSRIGIAFIKGLQGDDPNYFKTIATSKHFAVHSGPESTRHTVNVNVSRHDLEDTYLPAFRATVTEGNVQSVMCAYNAVDGQPACANDMLLGEHLRKDWGFKGYVVSDCGAAADIFDWHHYKPNAEEGVAVAFKAGMDVICGDYRRNMTTEPEAIVGAVQKGLLPQSVVDQALTRLFTARMQLGMFDPPSKVPYSKIEPSQNDTPAHRAVALKMARESIVLLKNDGLLPLKNAPKTIAVVGPNADSVDALVGNYNGTPSQPTTVLAGIRKRFPNANVVYAEGTGLVGPVTSVIPSAMLCVDSACKTHGLKMETFSVGEPKTLADLEPKGNAQSTSTVDHIDATWSDPNGRRASVRWTGFVTAPETGDYTFGFTSEDGYRVWVDNKLTVDDWSPREMAVTQTGKIHLDGKRTYPIKIEAFQTRKAGTTQLVWALPSEKGESAVAAAKKADLVIFVAGLSSHIEGEEMKVDADGFAGGDRTKLDLPGPQQQLLERVAAAGKPTVLVLMNGSAMAVNWADQHLPAIIEAWYPGEDGGTAVAQLLAGDFSPAGRLPVTFYKSVDALPPFDDYSMKGRTYRYFDGEPLYPFGFGLSYTKFAYANPRTANIGASQVKVSVDLTNSGSADGDEVVQLYLTHPGVAGAPIRALKGFQRVHLKKGEKKTVEFTLNDRDLSIVDETGKRRVVPGQVDAWIGGGQPVARAGLPETSGVKTQFTVSQGTVLPD
jgi:beta-glucosidase